MKNHETTEITNVELQLDNHRDSCDVVDPDELALVRAFLSILDEWDRGGKRIVS